MALFDPAAFSLVEGGPLYRLARAAGAPAGKWGLERLGAVLAVLTWVPLLVLTAWQGSVIGAVDVSFVESLGTHARFLVAIPLFFTAEAWFDPLCRAALGAIVRSRIVTPADLPRLSSALESAARWRDSWALEAALAVITVGFIVAGVRADVPADVSTWRVYSGGAAPGPTAAGWWYTLVSVPIFQFLSWRWCARLLIWWVLLWRLARLDLQLIPTHPDQAGGLGGLGVAQTALCPLAFGVSAILVATFAEEILFGGTDVKAYVLSLAGIVVGSMVGLLLPLFFFFAKLVGAKQRGLLEYGALATTYTRAFDAKWLHGGAPPDEPLLGSADIQSLADLANSFNIVRGMRLVPFTTQEALLLAASAALPIAPLVLVILPFDELLIRGVKSLLSIE